MNSSMGFFCVRFFLKQMLLKTTVANNKFILNDMYFNINHTTPVVVSGYTEGI